MYFVHLHAVDWRTVAAAQAGAISRSQLLAGGMSPSSVHRRLRNGTLVSELPGVYSVGGSADTVERRRWIAVLAVGGHPVLSFDSAARMHGLSAVAASGPVVLTVPHSGSQALPGVVVHQIDDLAATWRRGRLGLALEDAVATKRTTFEEVGQVLRSVARRGKPGVRLLTALLDEHRPGEPVAESVLERDWFRLVDRSPLPRPVRQHALPRTDGVRGLVDSAWPAVKLVVEIDGRRWHQRIADMKRDRDRDLHASAAGWLVVRLLHEHVVGAPEETMREVVSTYEVRRHQLGAA
jgi:hypothetical protein